MRKVLDFSEELATLGSLLFFEGPYEHPGRQWQIISLIVGREDDRVLPRAGRR